MFCDTMKSASRPRVARERRREPRRTTEPAPVAVAAPDPMAIGTIEQFGYSNAAGGWLFCGSVPRAIAIEGAGCLALIHFEQTRCRGAATLAFYEREDPAAEDIGVLAFISGSSRAAGALEHVALHFDQKTCRMQSGLRSQRLAEPDLMRRVRAILVKDAYVNAGRDSLLSIISRPAYTGLDTLRELSEPILMEVEEAFLCPPCDVLIKGWVLAAPGIIRSIRVRSGPLVGALVLDESIRVSRGDVIAAHGEQTGLFDLQCGFVARVPAAISKGDMSYLEVEIESGEIGFKPLRLSRQTGLPAMKQIMEGIDLRYDELDDAFDRILGPALSQLNAARSRDLAPVHRIHFGRPPPDPQTSVVIPLFGRIDFLEYQLALFSRNPVARHSEILYVLDDPPRRRDLEALAHSAFERFAIPFALLILPENLGFAAACNIGLRAARGEFIGFVNSDVFPISDNWLEQLVARLKRDPGIGIIGPRLLFEDGTVQHEGCCYRRIKEFGNWFFIDHVNKGRIPDQARGMRVCDAITGACMVMRRSLALEVGGFDEDYIIGDFEDSDLCLKLTERGLTCVVTDECQLYHLERKSQAPPSQGWRRNITLYNAWTHQRRWVDMLTRVAGSGGTDAP
jgi:GT2 family glycosyltransferase